MTAPSKEALELAAHLYSTPGPKSEFATLLDAHRDAGIAAALKRQAEERDPFGPPDIQQRFRDQLARANAADERASKRGVARLESELRALRECVDAQGLEMATEKAAHEATRAAHNRFTGDVSEALGSGSQEEKTLLFELRNALDVKESDRRELEATKTELAREKAANGAARKGIESLARLYRASCAELESLRKPLEGELEEDVATVRRYVYDWRLPEVDRHAFDRVVTALPALLGLYEAAKKCDPALTDVALEEPGRSIARATELVTELLAKGGPQAKPAALDCDHCGEADVAVDLGALKYCRGCFDTLGKMAEEAYGAKGEPQAAEPPEPRPIHPECAIGVHHSTTVCANCSRLFREQEPRPIVVGSKWRSNRTGLETEVLTAGAHVWLSGYADNWHHAEFRRAFTWVSDPEPATPAPELPRKVELGTTLTVGARYRITEVASWDRDPVHVAGDELGCCQKAYRLGGLEPEWDGYSERHHHGRGHWVAHTLESCTYVTGLELVAEAPKGKP